MALELDPEDYEALGHQTHWREQVETLVPVDGRLGRAPDTDELKKRKQTRRSNRARRRAMLGLLGRKR